MPRGKEGKVKVSWLVGGKERRNQEWGFWERERRYNGEGENKMPHVSPCDSPACNILIGFKYVQNPFPINCTFDCEILPGKLIYAVRLNPLDCNSISFHASVKKQSRKTGWAEWEGALLI